MTSLDGEQTMAAKEAYKQLAQTYSVNVRGYRADNGRFSDKGWREDCNEQNQALTFCGVGAHHQNGIAEKRICDLSEGARTSLLHAIQRWPEAVSMNLWPFALKMECEIANRVKIRNGTSAEEKIAKTTRQQKLNTYHPFGCPVFVLDSALQGGLGKIP